MKINVDEQVVQQLQVNQEKLDANMLNLNFFTFFENMPSFVPVLFEMTVYFAAHLMVITFYLRSKLWPFKKSENPLKSTTDDKFLIEIHSNGEDKKIKALLKKTGALEINMHEKQE